MSSPFIQLFHMVKNVVFRFKKIIFFYMYTFPDVVFTYLIYIYQKYNKKIHILFLIIMYIYIHIYIIYIYIYLYIYIYNLYIYISGPYIHTLHKLRLPFHEKTSSSFLSLVNYLFSQWRLSETPFWWVDFPEIKPVSVCFTASPRGQVVCQRPSWSTNKKSGSIS